MARRSKTQVYGITTAQLYKPATDGPIPVVLTDVRGVPRQRPGFSVLEGENGLSKFLTLNGAGVARDITGNASVNSPITFSLIPPAGYVYMLTAVTLSLYSVNMSLANFGAIAALTNGCLFRVTAASVPVFDFLGGFPLKSNSGVISYVDTEVATKPSGTIDFLNVSFHPLANSGSAIPLDSAIGTQIDFVLQDNLTGVGQVRVHCRGWIEPSV